MEMASVGGTPVGASNLTALFGFPAPKSALSAGVRGDGYNSVYFKGSVGNFAHLFEIKYKPGVLNSWTLTDLSAYTGSDALVSGDPAFYAPQMRGASNTNTWAVSAAVTFSTGPTWDGHIHRYQLSSDSNNWMDVDISAAANAPAGTNPVGYVTSDGTDCIIYTDGSNILELSTYDGWNWGVYNITSHVHNPAAVGPARPYVRTDNANAIVYRDTFNKVRELAYFPGFYWKSTNLFDSASIGTRHALTDPVPYIRADGTNAVIYLDDNQHLWELDRGIADTRWTATDLTALTASPNPLIYGTAPVASGSIRSDGTTVVIFRGGLGGHVHQLRFLNGAWQPYDAAQDDLTPGGS